MEAKCGKFYEERMFACSCRDLSQTVIRCKEESYRAKKPSSMLAGDKVYHHHREQMGPWAYTWYPKKDIFTSS